MVTVFVWNEVRRRLHWRGHGKTVSLTLSTIVSYLPFTSSSCILLVHFFFIFIHCTRSTLNLRRCFFDLLAFLLSKHFIGVCHYKRVRKFTTQPRNSTIFSMRFPSSFRLASVLLISGRHSSKINTNDRHRLFVALMSSSSTSSHTAEAGKDAASMVSTPKFLEPKIVRKPVNDYATMYGFQEDAIATELRHLTASHPRSRMMGDPIEAAFFGNVLLPAMNTKKVIEIGVFTGYTTLILAKAVGHDGTVLALDVSDEFTSIGMPYWKRQMSAIGSS